MPLPHDFYCRLAIKSGEPEIGKHDIRAERIQRADKAIPGINAQGNEMQARFAQFGFNQLGIGRLVFQQQDAQRLLRVIFHAAALDDKNVGAAGRYNAGGWFTSSQYSPSSFTFRANSSNSTGLLM